MLAYLQRTFLNIRASLESSMDAMMRKMEDTSVRTLPAGGSQRGK